ncbi:hypothetical protein [Acaryochloris marina]|uniref:Uncharacterized protein n=1 Tax=Acaryochloris marina (strain MBIC 11017) TaxID=329726 RepID=B0C4S6_ACAM1|nr:hypothetical protein [Acaryochloris marina]ABW31064.1 conserved hypothetical protein [Acaryochloris marina MBIC11017]BDM79777.1 hypothetical protein AM10699_26450 [Acaryochloris marina MBIC10699]
MAQWESIDHDGLFKELIETFFWEFLNLFLLQVFDYVERGPVTFLFQEVYSSIGAEERRIIDLLGAGSLALTISPLLNVKSCWI